MFIFHSILGQPYQGGESSGFHLQSVYYCSTEWLPFQSSVKNSGFDSKGLLELECSDIIKYTGSGIGSGFDFRSNYYCDSLNQKPSFKGDSMSGHFVNAIYNCLPVFVRGDSMSGHFVNIISYCLPITYNGTNSSGFNRSLGDCLIPLPIEMMNFKVEKYKNNHGLISWEVYNEINVDFYEVQKSLDGAQFQALHYEKAENVFNSKVSYSMTDSNPAPTINYYRIMVHDYDGRTYYSEIKTLDFTELRSIKTIVFYPNPIYGDNPIYLRVPQNTDFSLEIWDLNGKILWSKTFSSLSGSSDWIEIPTNHWSKGIYIFRYRDNEIENIQKIVKY